MVTRQRNCESTASASAPSAPASETSTTARRFTTSTKTPAGEDRQDGRRLRVDNQPLFGKPIEDILPEDPARARRSASPPPFESASRDRSADDLLAIARYQRWMMVCVLVHVLAVLMFPLAAIMEMEGNQPDEKNKGVVLLIFGLVMILVGVFALVLQVIFLLLA